MTDSDKYDARSLATWFAVWVSLDVKNISTVKDIDFAEKTAKCLMTAQHNIGVEMVSDESLTTIIQSLRVLQELSS